MERGGQLALFAGDLAWDIANRVVLEVAAPRLKGESIVGRGLAVSLALRPDVSVEEIRRLYGDESDR